MASRTTRILALLALVLAVAAVVPATVVVRDSRLLWTLVPVISAAWVFWLIRRRSLAGVWVLSGVSLGFVVLAAWSIGFFFAPSALVLLAAAVGHSVSMRPGWQALLIPAWFIAGPTGLCALFFVVHRLAVTVQGGELTEAPAIVAGTELFVGVAALLLLVTGGRWMARRVEQR
jgi:hypothetical protein